MIPASRGFNRFSSQQSGQSKINSVGERFPINRTLMEVIKGLDGASTEMVERSKTIFFPARIYHLRFISGISTYPNKHDSTKNDVFPFFQSMNNLYVIVLSNLAHLHK